MSALSDLAARQRRKAARQIRALRAKLFKAPPEVRRLVCHWVRQECRDIARGAPRYFLQVKSRPALIAAMLVSVAAVWAGVIQVGASL